MSAGWFWSVSWVPPSWGYLWCSWMVGCATVLLEVPVILVGSMLRWALLHSVKSRRAEAALDVQDQITRASSSKATVSRRFAGSSTAGS
jgi:hypothetical protein